jgi:hypothetical protein
MGELYCALGGRRRTNGGQEGVVRLLLFLWRKKRIKRLVVHQERPTIVVRSRSTFQQVRDFRDGFGTLCHILLLFQDFRRSIFNCNV